MDKFTFIKKAIEICGLEEGEYGCKKIIDKHNGENHIVAYSTFYDDEILYFRGYESHPDMIFVYSYKKTGIKPFSIEENKFINKKEPGKNDFKFDAENMRKVAKDVREYNKANRKNTLDCFWEGTFKKHINEMIVRASSLGQTSTAITINDVKLKDCDDNDFYYLYERLADYLRPKGFLVLNNNCTNCFGGLYTEINISWEE